MSNDSPLLLLPGPQSVWLAGSSQWVKWSRKHNKTFPPDTTIDIVLVDSTTNKKIFSLKRFIPLSKGAVKIRVPTTIPADVSFVLVLELYHGRSQQQLASSHDLPPASIPMHSSTTIRNGNGNGSGSGNGNGNGNENNRNRTRPGPETGRLSSISRRSDISILPVKSPRHGSPDQPMGAGLDSSAIHDLALDIYYNPSSQNRPLDFLPDEMRQEYPNVRQVLELKHTFGLHQKVYTLTPYTLEWKLPRRVRELFEYSKTLATLRKTLAINGHLDSQSAVPSTVFVGKVLIELVKDQSMESAAILAKDVPAETMFLYLRIQDRVPQDFYRLRVRMVVIEFSASTLATSADGQEIDTNLGADGRVIDRYEAVTRRFWVTPATA
ncbi:hypothetical protein BGZ94_004030 [Podila epigama]|nr:hypothetical protein BGZ94_004030 [Podila epigama]